MKILIIGASICLFTVSCKENNTQQINTTSTNSTNKELVEIKNKKPLTNEFKAYWFKGEAEVSSYKLEQYRYGELRKGHANLIFVTEPFLTKEQVKANQSSNNTINVLKLNTSKKFVTGIYPYSIMESVFFPLKNNSHAMKVSASVQEWCGQAYTQINNKNRFEVTSHSYFQNEADEDFSLNKTFLENEIWTQLRINPKSLPVGKISIIPSLEFCRLQHKAIKSYQAEAILTKNSYSLSYQKLNRTLKILFTPEFPYQIIGWEETVNNQTSKASLLKTIKLDYWNKNSNKDVILRDTLQLTH